MRSPEVVDFITANEERKSFMTLGARKLVLWKMDVLYSLLTQLRWD